MREFWRPPRQLLHQSRIPQCCGEVDPLLLECPAIIKGSGIAKISHESRPSQDFEAFAGTNRRRISRYAPVKKIGHPQAAVRASPFARCLHLLEIYLVANAPGQA